MNIDTIIKLIDYITKEPAVDNHKIGYKYPFNASEVLTSENVFVIDKFFEERYKKEMEEAKEENESSFIIDKNCNDKEHSDPQNEDQISEANSDKNEVEKEKSTTINEKIDTDQRATTKGKNETENDNNCDIDLIFESRDNDENKNGGSAELHSADNMFNNLDNNEGSLTISKGDLEENNNTNKTLDYPIINHLFNFLSTEEPINYVLAGYFFKVFSHLSNLRSNQIMSYLLLHKVAYIKLMINHLNRKSISDALLKVFVSYSADIPDQEIKKELLHEVLNSYDSNEEEVLKLFYYTLES